MNHIGKIPFLRCYWVIPDKMLAGVYPGAKDSREEKSRMEDLLDCGIRHIVNLMEDDERDHSGNLFSLYQNTFRQIAQCRGIDASWVRFPIRDVSIPSIDEMKFILDDIDGALGDGRPVYVHCWGGKGRTGTTVGCYLIRHGLAAPDDVLDTIKALRRNDPRSHEPSPETRQQCDFVCRWQPK